MFVLCEGERTRLKHEAREAREREKQTEKEQISSLSPFFLLLFLPLTNPTANASGIIEEITALCKGPEGSTSLKRSSSSAVEAPSGQLLPSSSSSLLFEVFF